MAVRQPLMVAGMGLQALGLAWFASMASASAGYAQLVVPLLVAGIGASVPIATVASAALSAVAPVDTGKASGVNSMVLTLGGAFGIAVVTAIFAAHGHPGTPAGFVAGTYHAVVSHVCTAVQGHPYLGTIDPSCSHHDVVYYVQELAWSRLCPKTATNRLDTHRSLPL